MRSAGCSGSPESLRNNSVEALDTKPAPRRRWAIEGVSWPATRSPVQRLHPKSPPQPRKTAGSAEPSTRQRRPREGVVVQGNYCEPVSALSLFFCVFRFPTSPSSLGEVREISASFPVVSQDLVVSSPVRGSDAQRRSREIRPQIAAFWRDGVAIKRDDIVVCRDGGVTTRDGTAWNRATAAVCQ